MRDNLNCEIVLKRLTSADSHIPTPFHPTPPALVVLLSFCSPIYIFCIICFDFVSFILFSISYLRNGDLYTNRTPIQVSKADSGETSCSAAKKNQATAKQIQSNDEPTIVDNEFVSDTFQTTEKDLEEVKAGMRMLGIDTLTNARNPNDGKNDFSISVY